ncbi:MAG: sialidase family protein [Anditalea sp.]
MKKIILISCFFTWILGVISCSSGNSQEGDFQQTGDLSPVVGVSTVEYEHVFEDERPFSQSHASTIIGIDGTYLLAWFAGSHEKNDDVGIWMAKGKPGAWSAPYLAVKVRNDPHWNPVLFHAPEDRIYLYFKVGKEIDDWETWVQYTDDMGQTWSKPQELVAGDKGGRGPVRNRPIVLSDGTWLAPASTERNRVWDVFVDRSDDAGLTWTATDKLELDRNVIKGEGVIQPALWESKPGHVHMLMRSSSGKICRSDSEDYGKTWSPIVETDLPNNNSGIDVAHISGESLALIYNPVGENWGKRYPITVALSNDNGKTWPVKYDIEKGEGDDELSYPAIFYEEGNLVACYTWNRERIAFWKGKLSIE